MFRLDNSFLEDTGLQDLPQEQRGPFLSYVLERIETIVGAELASGLTKEQEDEFYAITDHDTEVIDAWLARYVPNYASDPDFLNLKQSRSGDDSTERGVVDDFVAAKWLNLNRPNYRDVVLKTIESVKREVISNRDAILGHNPASTDQTQA